MADDALVAALLDPHHAAMQQARGLQAGMMKANPVELAMGLIGPRVPFPARISNPIKAYHGSPHDFNEFSLSKIGTGEGAQAYGHGLYFAENPTVAESYKNILGGREFAVGDKTLYSSAGGSSRVLDKQSRGQTIAADALDDAFNAQSTSPAQFAANRLRYQRQHYPEEAQHIDEALKVIGDWQASGGAQRLQGKTYEVNLHATPEQFLDWDKPLSGQAPMVRDAVNSVTLPPNTQARNPQKMRELAARFRSQGDEGAAVHLERDAAAHDAELARSGVEAYNAIRRSVGNDPHAPQAAADRLREAGIPGIRYLDQGSRTAGQGTSNYVVWTPEIIEILRKYGLAGPAALGAMHGMSQQQDAPQQ